MSSHLMSYSQAIEAISKYKKSGLMRKAQQLIDNVDTVLTYINIDRGRDPEKCNNISSLLKLRLYRENIETASSDADIARVVTVTKLLLEDRHYLEDDLANMDEDKNSLTKVLRQQAHLERCQQIEILSDIDTDKDYQLKFYLARSPESKKPFKSI